MYVEFAIDVVGVALDGVQREEKPGSDLGIGQSFRDELQYFKFAFAQRLNQVRFESLSSQRGSLLHVLLTIMRLQNPWLTKLAISQLIEDFTHVTCDVEVIDGQPSLVLRPDYLFFQALADAVGNSELDI